MKINRALNFVMPIERDGANIYVHSTPIGREVFERYFVTISKTFGALVGMGGIGITAAPRVASMTLKKVAQDMGEWEGPEGVEAGLMGEMRRLTNVLTLGDAGWQMEPFSDAIARGLFDREDGEEIENALVFFTVGSAIWPRRDRETMLAISLSAWNAETSSRDCMELANSLTISTGDASSGEKVQPSSIPS